MREHANREIGLGVAIVLLAALGLLFAIPQGIDMPAGIEVQALAPNFWPTVVMVGAGLAGVIVALQGVIDRKTTPGHDVSATPEETVPSESGMDDERPFAEATLRVAITLAALFALYFAIPKIGIVVGSMLILVFLMRLAGERRWRMILPISLLLPLALYFFFVHVANVPMPLGIFEALR